jgi:hypothetical protein
MLAYSLNQAVDAVQAAKKSWVSNWVFDSTLAGHLNKFVDTQTEYTKAFFSNAEMTGMALGGYAFGKAQDATKTAAEWAKKLTPKA